MGFLDRLKKREENQYQKMQNKDYYFSEESKRKFIRIKRIMLKITPMIF